MHARTFAILAGAVSLCAAPAPAQQAPQQAHTPPEYPEGAEVPRSLTDAEREFLKHNPLTVPAPRGPYPAPIGPIRCPAEYDPVEGVLIAWEQFTPILAQMAARVTNNAGALVYVVVDTPSEQTTAQSTLASYGVDLSRARWVVRATDTVWIRDYGPRYIYEGDCRAIVDHVYNRPRPNDDVFPVHFASYKRHARYDLPLIHGGGNFHLNGIGDSFVTRLVNNENPARTEQQIHDLWRQYQNVGTTFFTPFPSAVDSTQHIDMWLQVIGPRAAVISDWDANRGSTQDQICNSAAALLQSRGWTVHRVPARLVGGVHYTYTNVVMCNNIVLVPSYTNASVAGLNAAAASAWSLACPDKQIYQINAESMISFAGALHCIMMHVPPPLGGESPTAFLRTPRGGQVFSPGAAASINWISDDDNLVTSADIRLSIDGGMTFPVVIASGIPDSGSFTWTVPNLSAPSARVRVIVRDADGYIGIDQSAADFQISGAAPPCPADWNASGAADSQDFFDFLTGFFQGSADYNGDGATDSRDLFDFLNALFAGC